MAWNPSSQIQLNDGALLAAMANQAAMDFGAGAMQQMQLQQQMQQMQMAGAGGIVLPQTAFNAWQQQQQQQPIKPQGGKGGYVKKAPTGDAGIVGLCAVTTKALAPVAHMDPEWTLEEMAWKVCGYIGKTAAKYWSSDEEKYTSRATVAKGQAIIEEFIEACMFAIHAACSEKPWLTEANLTDPLFHAVMNTFQNSQTRFMCRTLRPVIQKTVDDAIARFREEERIQKGLWESVVISGLPDAQQKACFKHLQNSFDRAHMSAPYGSTKGDTPEISIVQDFVKGWMEDFCGRAWNVLTEGVGPEQEEQYAFLTTLFQHLTDPEQCCLPFELVSQPGATPPENWQFVADIAMAALKGETEDGASTKKKFAAKGGKKGGGKWGPY